MEVKGDIFGHTIYPPSLVTVAFIFLELRRGGGGGRNPPCPAPAPVVEDQKKPGLNRVKVKDKRVKKDNNNQPFFHHGRLSKLKANL